MSGTTIERLNAALSGRYLVEREIGEGGMATVYLAEDVKHERKVALKVLKPELAAVVGAERFLAEIKTTANLQHPHILPLHDSGEAGSFLYYVMPYVEGESLREKLEREKQLPVGEAVHIAVAVAGALDYAHRHKVIHRDIKPANILIHAGQPVVADFGIALAVGAAGGARLTETGLSVGTPYYMSPEQATGDVMVGPATDIYAVACVLYEMLVGEPPYLGNTAQAVLGKIIAGDAVSATKHRPAIPPNVDAAIRKALEKLPADRFSTAEAFATALTDVGFRHGFGGAGAEAGQGSSARRRVGLAASAVLGMAVGAGGWAVLTPDPPVPVSRYAIALPDGHDPARDFGSNLTISPDGSRFVYVGPSAAGGRGGQQLWMRRRDQLEPTPMPGTEGAMSPAFSPDGRRVAFRVGNAVRAVSLGGEPPLTVAADGVGAFGLTWGDDGYIYADHESFIGRVPETGGVLEPVTSLDSTTSELDHGWPQALPGGRGVIFTVFHSPTGDHAQYDLAVLDHETGTHRVLVRGVFGRYAPSGHLVYVSAEGTLLAAPFDLRGLQLTGPPVAMLEGVGVQDFGSIELSVASDGTLAYVTGIVSSGLEHAVWVTRNGEVTPIDDNWEFAPGRPEVGLELSPDGTRLAVKMNTDAGEDIWVKELDRGPLSRLSFDPAIDRRPRWSPDGRWVYYTSDREGVYNLFRRASDGTGSEELVLDLDRAILEAQPTPDGEWWALRLGGESGVTGLRDIVALRTGETETLPIAAEPYDEKAAALSPDGRWIAYESNETGDDEIYVRPFPNAEDGKWQVSAGGGLNPRWSRGGGEIFFITTDGQMSVAEVSTQGGFRVGQRSTLFNLDERGLYYGSNYTAWDVAPDGERFVFVQFAGLDAAAASELVIIENFFHELEARLAGS
jgi:eukaryotic-like serine/threonine-protein kinase